MVRTLVAQSAARWGAGGAQMGTPAFEGLVCQVRAVYEGLDMNDLELAVYSLFLDEMVRPANSTRRTPHTPGGRPHAHTLGTRNRSGT